jgi:hypothetical protein
MNTHSKALQAARKYTLRGWHVIPIDLGSKKPSMKDWQRLRLEIGELDDHFDEPKNVGVLLGKPSRHLIDVDLDCSEAIELAEHFLPRTKRIHGRKSKMASHYWYYAKFRKGIEKFNDINGTACLLEVRGQGHQTLVPPSIHPDGERLRWESTGRAKRISTNKLLRAARKLASAVILARHWPTQGSRNETALALAGVLLRADWTTEATSDFIGQVARAGHDEEWRERCRTAVATGKKLNSNSPATGIPRLNTLLGEKVVAKVLEWLDIEQMSMHADHRLFPHDAKWPKPLGENAYHGLAGQFVRTIEPQTEADSAALLVQFLTAFGNCVGSQPHFRVEGAQQRANLFCMVIGRSSKARKGTAWAHVRRIFEKVDLRWAQRCTASNLSSGEGLAFAVADSAHLADTKHGRQRVADAEQPAEKRLLVVQTEFASALRIQRREGNILSPIVRQAWDSAKIRILTKNSRVETTDAHVSIIGHITVEELARELKQTDEANGYANRFLFVCARRSKILPLGGNLNDRDLQAMINGLIKAKHRSRKITNVSFSQAAEDLWCSKYEQLTAETPGMLGAITARAEAQVLRLALVYALLDCSAQITRRHLRAALSVWKYCARSARHVFGGTLGQTDADRILNRLRNSPHGLTRTEIRELFKHNADSSRIERALDFLAQYNLAKRTSKKTSGRPIQKWRAI